MANNIISCSLIEVSINIVILSIMCRCFGIITSKYSVSNGSKWNFLCGAQCIENFI